MVVACNGCFWLVLVVWMCLLGLLGFGFVLVFVFAGALFRFSVVGVVAQICGLRVGFLC